MGFFDLMSWKSCNLLKITDIRLYTVGIAYFLFIRYVGL